MHSPFRHTALPLTTMTAQGHDLTDDYLMLILLTADAHFGAHLGAFFYWTRCFENNLLFDNTTPIYLMSLLWKLGLGFRLDSELHYSSIFMENKESEHLIFRQLHGR